MRIGQLSREEFQALLNSLKTVTESNRNAIVETTVYSNFLSASNDLRNAICNGPLSDLRNAVQATVYNSPLSDLRNAVVHQMLNVGPLVPPPGGPATASGHDDHRMITINAGASISFESPITPAAPPAPPPAASPWLDTVAFLIPRSIREPFLGDLREDLTEMASRGRSQTAVRWATVSQVVVLVLRWAWSQGLPRWLSFLGGG